MSKSKIEVLRNELQTLLKDDELDYRAILKISNQLSKLDEKFQHFFVDAKTLIHLGRDSIKDHTTALMELVKNSYDADSYNVEVQILNNKNILRVADNGFGMTKEQLLNNWLRIGFSNKRISKLSDLGRRKTGEKGIGRISTDRLGANIELISKTRTDGIVGLKVNWDDFDIEGKDVFDINIEITKPTSIDIPLKNGNVSDTGTEIKITNLRQPWTRENIEGLYYELSALTPPFGEIADFKISLDNDVSAEFSRTIDSDYYKASEIDVTAIFDGTDEVYYTIKDKYSEEEIVETISLNTFYSKQYDEDDDSTKIILKSGPISVRLLFFLREGASVKDQDFKLSDLREFLDNNAGVKIYRDQIAVKPYGFPTAQMGYDWLNLGQRKARNPAGVGRSADYTVSPNQLVGAIFIERDKNPLLNDSAAREGLVESEGFYDMKNFVLATIRLLESHRAKIYTINEKVKAQKNKDSAHKEADKIKERLTHVKDELQLIQTQIRSSNDSTPQSLLEPITTSIKEVESISVDVEDTIIELLNWQRVLNGLATIGISSTVFGHETEGSITQFQGSANTALRFMKLPEPNIDKALTELEKALKHSKRIAAWGAYALTRVQKEKRTKRNIKILKTLEGVVRELRPAFEASSIDLSVSGQNIYANTYQMDIESILVNLLTNSYTACLLKGGERKVRVYLDREIKQGVAGFYFCVGDTGPGIAKEFEHSIFNPLFSTKTTGANDSKSVGTGLGLTIVKSVVEELNGEISFSKDLDLGGANFKIWLPRDK